MKNYIYLAIMVLPMITYSQNEKLTKAIIKGKLMMEKADTVTEYTTVANYFERIKFKEKEEWLPAYYQALSLTFGSQSVDVEEKEANLIIALSIVQEAQKIDKNSELVALEGFIQMMRLTVDPATRGRTLSPLIFGLYQESIELDPSNARAMLFLGQMHFGMAQFMGSGTEDACGFIKKAEGLFANESKDDTIFPSWGKKTLTYSLSNCNQ